MNKDKDKTINIATTNVPAGVGMPLLNLSMNDKIYLAVANGQKNNLHFVYSLFCRQDSHNKSQYTLLPESEVAVFKDAAQAELYFGTLSQIKYVQSRDGTNDFIFSFADKYIQDFKKKTR